MGKTFIAELLERRVPQFMGGYLAIGWGLISFSEFLTEHYLLSKHLIDGVILLVLALAPAALLVAYTHGKPGKDPWKRWHKGAVALNIVLAVSLVTLQLQGKDLGRTVERVSAIDEEGRTIERLVAKEGFRRKVGLFEWRNTSGDESLDWLRLGLPLMLDRDLEQNIFFTGVTQLNPGVHARLKRAGHRDGTAVPLALAREVSKYYSRDYFVNGELEREDGRFRVRLKVYQTASASQVADIVAEAGNPMELVDAASLALAPHLDLQSLSAKRAVDLPIEEQLSASVAALEAYVEGQRLLSFENDYSRSAESFRRAIAEDSGFAVAHLRLAESLAGAAENSDALGSVSEALRRDYRLTEYEKFTAKGFRYFLTGEVEKIVPLYETWTELYPDDVRARYSLASAYLQDQNQVEKAVATYRRILQLDPTADGALFQAARLLKVQGKIEESLGMYRTYVERNPESSDGQLSLGSVYWYSGQLEKAREHLEKASLLSSDDLRPAISLANLNIAEAKLPAAESLIDSVESQARTPAQKIEALNARVGLLTFGGRYREASRLHQQGLGAFAGRTTPVDQWVVEMLSMGIGVTAGRLPETLTRLGEIKAALQPPMDQLSSIGYMLAYSAAGDADRVEPYIVAAEELIKQYRRDDMLYLTAQVRGLMLLQKGRNREAVSALREALNLAVASPLLGNEMREHSVILTQLGRAQHLAGDLDAAKKSLTKALIRVPALPVAHLRLAQLHRQEGQLGLAGEHLERALAVWAEADSSYPPAQEARALASELGRAG